MRTLSAGGSIQAWQHAFSEKYWVTILKLQPYLLTCVTLKCKYPKWPSGSLEIRQVIAPGAARRCVSRRWQFD